jgi:hypothetical protein
MFEHSSVKPPVTSLVIHGVWRIFLTEIKGTREATDELISFLPVFTDNAIRLAGSQTMAETLG